MKRVLFSFTSILMAVSGSASAFGCDGMGTWLSKPCHHLAQTYRDGNSEILLSGYAWHLPMTYTKEKRSEFNEYAFGFGKGRTVEAPNGNTHSVFFLAFLESHKKIQWNLGYSWSTYWGERDSLQFGLGYTALIVQRPDIFHGIPFPGALPLVSLRYRNASVVSTFIPTLNKGINNGSVLYTFARYTFK